MAQIYDPSENLRSGLNTMAQSFIAGMQTKQQKEAADREFQFRQEQAQAEAERQAKAQAAQQAISAYQTGLKGIEAGQRPEDVDRFTRAMAPQLYPDIVTQKPVSEILPPQELPAVRPPMRAPVTDEQRNALQQIQVLGERLNSIDNLPIPENIKSNLREYLTGQLRQHQDVAFGAPSQVQELKTRPRGESFAGARPIPIRPAGAVEERKPAPSLFQAPPAKPLKPEADPLEQTQKEIELNFRGGRVAPEEMQRYYQFKGEYYRTKDRDAFLRNLQAIKFREKPMREAAGAGTADTRAKFNLLLGYQDVVHTTEQDIDRIEDNKRDKQKEITDLNAKIAAVDSNLILSGAEKKERKDSLQKELNKANNEFQALELGKIKNLKRIQTITKSVNQLEKEVGLPGELETEQAEDARTERARNLLDEQGYETEIFTDEQGQEIDPVKTFLQNNPDFE